MHKSLITGLTLLVASALLPSCVELADDPSVVTTEREPASTSEAASTREPGASLAAPEPTPIVMGLASDCFDERMCLWEEDHFNGRRVGFRTGLGCQNLGPYGIANQASSWFNNTSESFRLYQDSNCTGSQFTAFAGTKSNQMGPSWDNNIQSICSGTSCP